MKDIKNVNESDETNNVPLSEFILATQNWQTVCLQNNEFIGNVILPFHFDIPMSDIISLLEEFKDNHGENYTKIRAYVGTKHLGEYNGRSDSEELRLYLTGVNDLGEPILEYDGESAIYDFTLPCPPTC